MTITAEFEDYAFRVCFVAYDEQTKTTTSLLIKRNELTYLRNLCNRLIEQDEASAKAEAHMESAK